MARSTIRCEIPKCRNVGRLTYEMLGDDGEEIVTGDLPYPICQKHFVGAVDDMCDRLTNGSVEPGQTVG